MLRGFGLKLPPNARVQGISIDVTRQSAPGSITDHAVHLVTDGEILGAERARAETWAGSTAPATYGSPTDSWDRAWTAAELNDPQDASQQAAAARARGQTLRSRASPAG